MSWETVSTAIQARLELLFPLAKVHSFIRQTHFGSDSDEFREVYINDVANPSVQVLQLTRVAFRQTKSTDDDTRWMSQHDVLLHYHEGLQDAESSELDFQSNIESICADFRTGDKTLGAVALTLSDPQVTEIGHAMLAEHILCHYAPIRFTVEEIL